MHQRCLLKIFGEYGCPMFAYWGSKPSTCTLGTLIFKYCRYIAEIDDVRSKFTLFHGSNSLNPWLSLDDYLNFHDPDEDVDDSDDEDPEYSSSTEA